VYRVEFGVGAQAQFHSLPVEARDALIDCAVMIAERPSDAALRPPGADARFRETTFGFGGGIVGFYVDDGAKLIRIFDIVWLS
jgi:hypothetical protein